MKYRVIMNRNGIHKETWFENQEQAVKFANFVEKQIRPAFKAEIAATVGGFHFVPVQRERWAI
jgi:hypothetical protein